MAIKLHKLTNEDLKWFVEVAAFNMVSYELGRPELYDPDTLYRLSEIGIQAETAFVAKDGNECVGALGSILIGNLLNPRIKTLAEVVWYVLPEYRQTRAGLILLNAFNERAAEIAHEATLSLLPSSTINHASLDKKGFKLCELAFRKEVNKWQ